MEIENVEFLPVGSFVLLNGGKKRIMIISRAIAMKNLNLAISAGGFRKITPAEWNEAKK